MHNIISIKSLERSGKPIITRAEAKAQGLTTYYTGKLCKAGHVSERYVSKNQCVACQLALNVKQVASGADAARVKRYKETNPDRVAAQRGWTSAKARGAHLPYDFRTIGDLIMSTIGFYQEARRLTQETGKSYVVDHIIPLTRGGQHHPGNLRVISNAFNFAKRNMTDIECLEAVFSGTWKGPRDTEVMTTLVDSVAHEFASLGASASIQANA
jgi:hypothetical protein